MVSNSQSQAIIEAIALYTLEVPQGYCIAAVGVLVMYDWVVTLSRELRLFWTGKARPLSAALYFSTKYSNILTQVLSMVSIWDFLISDKGCTMSAVVDTVVVAVSLIPPAVFTGLRAYALTQRRWLLAVIFLLSSIPVVANMARVGFNISGYHLPFIGCVYNTTFSSSLGHICLYYRISLILADTVLIVITWRRIVPGSAVQVGRQFNVTKSKGLASVMLYDGMLYFVVLLSLNILQLVFTELSVLLDGESDLIGAFTGPLSSVLVSHFLLDLQEAHQRKVVGLATDDPLHTSQTFSIRSVQFMPALGSLAAIIDPTDYDREDGDEGVVDQDRFEVGSEDLPMRSDSGDSSGDVRAEDESAIMEVSRTGDVELAVGL